MRKTRLYDNTYTFLPVVLNSVQKMVFFKKKQLSCISQFGRLDRYLDFVYI